MSNNPNILFIINHDLSRRANCYGNTPAVTPNIDRLAARGLLFESHFCNYALWDVSHAVPLVISGPGLPEGVRTSALTEHVDVYPTLCELCGLPRPPFLEGTSAGPLTRDPDLPGKPAVFASRRDDRSVRTQRYRYSEFRDAAGTVLARELFDYRDDPFESRNLAGMPACRELERELATTLTSERVDAWKDA